jgi:prepilin-type N-terminal cleavage/methylation domain-containing protein
MLMLGAVRHLVSGLRAEQGVTLIELLVAMVAGAVVIVALITIIDTTLHQSTRTFSRVDATTRSRTALEQIENELHSACIGDQLTPIQVNSTGSSLIFQMQYGNSASPSPVEHRIDYNSAGAGTLTDTVFVNTGDATGAWTFSTTAATVTTLLNNVGQYGAVPFFQYYNYQQPMNGGTPYTDAAGHPYEMLLDGNSTVPNTTVIPTAAPLTDASLSTTSSPTTAVATAASVAEVQIEMNVGPALSATGVVQNGESTTLADARATVNDSVVFRVTPPANVADAGAVFSPCQ